MSWYPHVTVATLVQQNNKYLLVEEVSDGLTVINQPAGHLEKNETLVDAAVRETLEETQWQVEVTSLLGLSLFESPLNGITYFRCSFIATPLAFMESQPRDSDILRTLWLTQEEIEQREKQLRSPMVLSDLRRYLAGESYPLSLIEHCLLPSVNTV